MQYNYNLLLRGKFVPLRGLPQDLFQIAAGLVLFATLGYSQVETAQISGKVLDPSGAVVRDAEVTLTKIGTDFKRSAKSDAEGSFLFPSVLPSSYQLRVAAPGFSTKQRVVSVAPGQKAGVDFTLEVGTAETMVQVSE